MSNKACLKQTIWPPFTHLKYAEKPVNIISSKGSYYYDEDGNKFIDAISSWWVNTHGHSHPYIAQKIYEQANSNAHSIFSGFTHPQATRLADRIIPLLPGNFSKVFFSDDGSTAVEVALKMSIQYFSNRNLSKRKIIALENGYHGDTFGSMSVGARNVFSQPYREFLFEVIYLPVPNQENIQTTLDLLENQLDLSEVAAFIFEPLVQGAGGMVMYEAKLLDKLIQTFKLKDIICIADEVMTGFGRTGKMFACEHLKEQPDIICLSKGLTGGFLPLGLTACKEFIYETFISNDKSHTFFHGHSYTANPISCAAANASLDLFQKEETLNKIAQITHSHLEFKKDTESFLNKNWEIRICGTIMAFEYIGEKREYLSTMGETVCKELFKKGIIIRPLGNVFYILPPYCISKEDLHYIYSEIKSILC